MPTSTSARPIQTLRDQITNLEAAITVCLADPGPKAVHKLRTTTRRVEAQLTLLDLLSDLPPHQKTEKKARRILKKLRRAAGNIRDFDVQIHLIEAKTSATTKEASDHLTKTLADQRTQAEADLTDILNKHQAKLTRTLEALLEALEPAKSQTLTATQLTTLAQNWFTHALPAKIHPDDSDQLHTIRKIAKLTRYIAETAPKSARTPRKLAAVFESLQQAGGEWHDWLILSAIAYDKLGDSSLTQAFRRQCQTALAAYRTRLQAHLS
ncbi:MAG TPA: CHAD domain-containing protein [Edaphobacter sp.]